MADMPLHSLWISSISSLTVWWCMCVYIYQCRSTLDHTILFPVCGSIRKNVWFLCCWEIPADRVWLMRNWFSPNMKRSWTTAVQIGIFMLAQWWCREIARREIWEIQQPAFLMNHFNLTRICSEWIRRVIKQIESMVKANAKPLLNTMIIQTFTIKAFVKNYPRVAY